MVGKVEALWRYPVKSMAGERLDEARVTGQGLAGDRAFALVDATSGKVASAKHPRRWGKLLEARAALDGNNALRITLPDGQVVGEVEAGEALSNWLACPVRLEGVQAEVARSYEVYFPDMEGLVLRDKLIESPLSAGAAPDTFFNFAPVHLVTTATLAGLRRLSPESDFEARRFRPNIVVDVPGEGFVENGWMGHLLALGNEVQLRATVACPRCVMTTLPQGDLPKDEGILRTVASNNRVDLGHYGVQACVGVYAEVVRGGTVRPGDAVVLLD